MEAGKIRGAAKRERAAGVQAQGGGEKGWKSREQANVWAAERLRLRVGWGEGCSPALSPLSRMTEPRSGPTPSQPCQWVPGAASITVRLCPPSTRKAAVISTFSEKTCRVFIPLLLPSTAREPHIT